MNFVACKSRIKNRRTTTDDFLTQLVAWAKTAAVEIFAPNAEPQDIYGVIKPYLGPWRGLPGDAQNIAHRRAAMCEALRVIAAFESEDDWHEGVDTTNAHSQTHVTGEEAGIFQVSYDSLPFGADLRALVAAHGVTGPLSFIRLMKADHPLALEYAARLLRHTVRANGPILRTGADSISPWLSREAVSEFEVALAA